MIGRGPYAQVLAVTLSVLLTAGPACGGRRQEVRVRVMSPEVELDAGSALSEMDRVLLEREQIIAGAVRELERSLVFQYRDAILDRTLPVLSALRVDAGEAARAGLFHDAATRYEAALVVSQLVMLEVNLVIIGDVADQAGQYSKQIVGQLNGYHQAMRPLLDAAMSLDLQRLAAELPEGARKYADWVAFANQWSVAVGSGAKISERVIRILDAIMIVFAVRQLAVLAAKGVSGGGPPLVPMPSGVIAATRLDVAALARTYAAIRKLVAIGAMDPVVVGGLAAFAGAAARPDLSGPVAWSMQGVDPPAAPPATPPASPEPGRWTKCKESMSDRAADFQEQQTGRKARIWEYKVGNVSFDGFKDGKLIEAKGPGYAKWLELDDQGQLRFRKFFEGAQSMEKQLYAQDKVAQGVPVEWRVAEPRLAEYLRQVIKARKLKITVVYVPPR